jgi:hypothetical protein
VDEEMKAVTATAALGVACLALWAVAVLLTAYYYVPDSGLGFNAALNWTLVLELIPRVGWREVGQVVSLSDAAFGISILLALGGAAASARGAHQKWRALGLLSPLVLLFPFNVLSCLALVVEAIRWSPHDGEFPAEDWLLIYAYAIWSILALVAFVWKGEATRHRPSPMPVESACTWKAPQNNRMNPTKPAMASVPRAS